MLQHANSINVGVGTRKSAQGELVMEICANIDAVGDVDINEVLERVEAIG